MRHEISKENYDKLYPGIADMFGASQEKEKAGFRPSQLISRADIDDAYDKLSQQLEATVLMFECEQRANMPLREKVEELAAELTHNSINFEREIEAWKRGSEAQANVIDNYKSALKKIARGTLEPGHVYEQAVMMQDIAIKALNDAHGCVIDGAKVCFACAECDPVVADRP